MVLLGVVGVVLIPDNGAHASEHDAFHRRSDRAGVCGSLPANNEETLRRDIFSGGFPDLRP